jgi:integrase
LLAVQILLGTGMRVGELCALTLTDFEDDDEASFLKVQRGKGPSFAACRSATGCAGS